jgi:hypothetical protein
MATRITLLLMLCSSSLLALDGPGTDFALMLAGSSFGHQGSVGLGIAVVLPLSKELQIAGGAAFLKEVGLDANGQLRIFSLDGVVPFTKSLAGWLGASVLTQTITVSDLNQSSTSTNTYLGISGGLSGYVPIMEPFGLVLIGRASYYPGASDFSFDIRGGLTVSF